MTAFEIKPGENVVGLGVDFETHLAAGETISACTAVGDAGLTLSDPSYLGTKAMVAVTVAADQPAGFLYVRYSVTGSAGSIRKASRLIQVIT